MTVALTSLWWTAIFNAPFLERLVCPAGSSGSVSASSVLFGLCAALALTCLWAALIELLALLPRPVFRTILLALNLTGAGAFAAATLYGTMMTPDMIRNFMATDAAEASAYLGLRSALVFLAAALPPAALGLWGEAPERLAGRGPAAALKLGLRRTGAAAGLLALGLAAIAVQFQAFAGAMRADRSVRYLIAPMNVVTSAVRTMTQDASPDAAPRRAVDPNPVLTAKLTRPAVLVVAVGETARSASWQLSGYGRETTPRLAALGDELITIPRVRACGSSTDVSLPCMMSRIGRSDYSRDRILSEEQLPSLLARAGAKVLWIDNQSGCKGACTGVETRRPDPTDPGCADGRCSDMVLAVELGRELKNLPADRPTVIFLHMMGSHGPAYSLRSTADLKRFEPECADSDLRSCSRDSLVNAYDNSIRETDAALAAMIGELKAASDRADGALVYVSDHGESLGESGLYLHGAPYWMAPAEQVEVPMEIWTGPGFRSAFGVSDEALRRNARGPVTQESLYHTVLGLLGVASSTRDERFDLTH